MLYKNHLLVSSAIALPIMQATNTLTPLNLITLGIGALLPDIDEPESYIGRRTRGISDLINLFFGHRGLTHTIYFVFAIGVLTYWLGSLTDYSFLAGTYLTFGVFLHILEDSFSVSGVRWLSPITDRSYHVPIYSTGSLIEFLIGFISLIVIFIGFKNGTLVMKKGNLVTIENMMNLIGGIQSKVIHLFLE